MVACIRLQKTTRSKVLGGRSVICEVRDNEVILKNPKISDILCFMWLMFHKDKEVVFTKPEVSK